MGQKTLIKCCRESNHLMVCTMVGPNTGYNLGKMKARSGYPRVAKCLISDTSKRVTRFFQQKLKFQRNHQQPPQFTQQS